MVSKKELIGFLAFLIYLISPIHSVELYYLSSVQTLLSTFFVLVGLLNYHKFSTGRKIINWYLSILVFITALLSHESAAVLIGILFLYEVFCKKNSFRRIVINLLPFVLLLFLRILVHFAYFGISQQQVYQPVFSPPSVINSFVWLSLWTIGLPEMLRDFMTLKFEINPNLFKYYGDYLLLITPIIGIILITVAIAFGRYFRNLNSIFYFLFFSFIISLTPFIFFPKHIFSYYLNLPLVFFAGFIVYPISNLLTWQKIGKFVVIFFVVAFLGLSWQTIQLNQSTHWAAKRAKAAKVILSSIKHEVPQIDKGANFFIKDDPGYPYISQDWGSSSKQVFYILSGSDALKLLYNDLSIKVYYEAIDSEKYNQEKMISLTPFFPY
ncbi:MAG: hypothetical protein HYW45_00415 [Candidatus Daviesbacteria bacterium]|nr:MAG: hypothetical protein HYW45_00415 [Candidatus Daviesbacteria bacterium]